MVCMYARACVREGGGLVREHTCVIEGGGGAGTRRAHVQGWHGALACLCALAALLHAAALRTWFSMSFWLGLGSNTGWEWYHPTQRCAPDFPCPSGLGSAQTRGGSGTTRHNAAHAPPLKRAPVTSQPHTPRVERHEAHSRGGGAS
eukprot:363637-Chlamydomonas_euryale.AAC.1